MHHVVQFSTGAASAEVAFRVVERFGPQQVTLLTADTMVEDADNWRFAREVQDRLGASWQVLRDGRTPMEAGRDERCVPNDRMAVCSKLLKRRLLRAWLDAECDPEQTVIYLGYDWTENTRIAGALPFWAPFKVLNPLAEPPFMLKAQVLDHMRDVRGIEPPNLYAKGFHHANCGGACVRGGQAQWELLLRVDRPLYLKWEADEEESRIMLGKDVSILNDRRGGGPRKPLTLRAFRERLDQQPSLFDGDDWGACDCMSGAA